MVVACMYKQAVKTKNIIFAWPVFEFSILKSTLRSSLTFHMVPLVAIAQLKLLDWIEPISIYTNKFKKNGIKKENKCPENSHSK